MPGRVKCGGTEEDIVVAHGCRKRKKLICGPKEEKVVAHGRLPSPAPIDNNINVSLTKFKAHIDKQSFKFTCLMCSNVVFDVNFTQLT